MIRRIRAHLSATVALVFAALLLAASATPALSQNTEIIRGVVLGPDSLPRDGVRVSAASRVTADIRTTTTDRNGRYTFIFPDGGGDYLLVFQQIGLLPLQRQVKRIADEDLLVLNVAMRAAATPLLDSVVVIAGRIRPPRNDGDPTDPTASEVPLTGGALPPGETGSLAKLAAEVAGVTLEPGIDGKPDGFSTLGLGADQNKTTLNGMTTTATDLPRDAITGGRVTTSTGDPSRGGFSGATLNVQSGGGTSTIQRYLNLTVDERRLQFVDPASTQMGKKYTNLQLSGRASGPLIPEKVFYAFSGQVGRRTSDVRTLLNTGALALRQYGAAHDSVQRTMAIMLAEGLPATGLGIPGALTTHNASTVLRGDWRRSNTHNLTATLTTSFKSTKAARLSVLAMPTHGGEDRTTSGNLQLAHSFYFGKGFLQELRTSFNVNRVGGDPYLVLPDVRVRVKSTFPDEGPGVATLQLGGNASLPATSNSESIEVIDDLTWITYDNKHRIKLTLEVKADRFDEDQSSNRLGTFTFNSLADFEEGRASEFKRQLTGSKRAGDLIHGALALGDQYKHSKDLQFTYGLRFEANRYGRRPTLNPAVVETFGVTNDRAPNRMGLSPRFGFTWTFGTPRQIAGFEGAQRTPRSTVRGNLGRYRNAPSSNLLQPAMTATGLPSGVQMLNCRGDAVPVPDWAAYFQDLSTVPAECADGAGATIFADKQPTVTLFDQSYTVPSSWRGNLAWSGAFISRYNASVEGTFSLNHDQAGTIDLNFRDSVFFTLGAEGDRPVFVAPSSISRSSGSIASRAARRSPAFSQVNARRSDLESRSGQIKLALSPIVSSRIRWNVSYVLAFGSELRRGFGGNTASNPLTAEWGPTLGSRHQFNPSVSFSIKALSIGVNGRLSSGVRFTPMVSGDVNGDGSGNDRAFVFDPMVESDTSIANAMAELLENAHDAGQRCLRRELGRVARRGSCEGPWTATLNLNFSLNPVKLSLPRRTVATLNFNNPLALVDRVVRGKASAGGMGQQYNPETTLLYVRGFDPVARKFRYEVNPRFGDTRTARAGENKPFLVTLSFRTELGPEVAKQNLDRTIKGWQSGKTRKPSESQLKSQYANPFVNPYSTIFRQADSLKMTTEQRDTLRAMNAAYSASIDSIWIPVAAYLAQAGENPDVDEAFRRVRQAQRRSYDAQMEHGPAVRRLLTSEQLRKLPNNLTRALDAKLILEAARSAGVR